MKEHFWLIQRGRFNPPSTATTFFSGSSTSLIDPEYMGSAEFEFGAIPKAYRRIMVQYPKYKLHVTDLVTVRGVPFCLYCPDDRYEKILAEIKRYIYVDTYHLKEWSNLGGHFHNTPRDDKHRLETNFWWCIDMVQEDDVESVGDWIGFIGAADRQNAFLRILDSEYNNWWMVKSEEDRAHDHKESFRR